MLREVFVQERVVRVQDVEHRAVALEEIGEEANRFFIHRAAQAGEAREVPLAFLAQLVEAVDVQPGAGELGRQSPHARVAEHPAGLRGEHVGVAQLALDGEVAQLGVRRGRPEEIAQARGQFPIIHRSLLGAWPRLLGFIEKRRRHEHACQRETNRFVVGQLLLAQPAVKAAQFLLLRFGERTAIGAISEFQDRVEVPGLRVDEALAERSGPLEDRLAHRLENLRVGVLRRVLPELLEGVDERERVVAHVV